MLDLGATPLANALLRSDQLETQEQRYPLVLALCSSCALAQLTVTVPPEILFRDYAYASSCSDAMVEHARCLAARTCADRELDAEALVVEIASNDGYLLQHYLSAGVPVLGIEPARNIAQLARDHRSVPTLTEFFGHALAERLVAEGHRADVIHANNVLAHVADLNGVVRGIATLLAKSGLALIEVPYVEDLLANLEFDTIYHEHLCYFSLTSLAPLMSRHGLEIVDVERLAIHGGSLRLSLAHRGMAEVSPRVEGLLEAERKSGVAQVERYREFEARVRSLGDQLRGLIHQLRGQGKRIAAYGASAKGSTLLNTLGVGRDDVEFIVDRSPLKQGRYAPGTHLPIHPTEHLLASMPEYTLLLTWNFADEIFAQQQEYRRRGGQFIVPVPAPRIC